jgi:surface carbohydrate biosynthesis protein
VLTPLAYLTCELKGRDLASRLLIASRLADRGYHTIVGQQWGIFSNLRAAAKGIVLFKTANKTQADWMVEARSSGHFVAASDEECLASAPGDYARLTHPAAAEACHAYLALNELHAAAIREAYPAAAHKVIVTGNARVDILRSLQPARPIHEPYILINTSFGRLNHVSGDVQTAVATWLGSGGHERNAETENMVQERLSFEKRAMAETIALITWIIANTQSQIVIRPHPAERSEKWSTLFQGNPRVHVVVGSDPTPWMRHATVLVHSESTTGVEAAIMGIKVLNLSPASSWGERLIVGQANVTVGSAAAAADLIAALLRTGEWPAPKEDVGALYPADGAEKTAAAIAGHLPPPQHPSGFQWYTINRTDEQREKFTVTLDEARALTPHGVMQIDDSVFLVSPRGKSETASHRR